MIPQSLNFEDSREEAKSREELLYNGTSYKYDFKEKDFVYKNGNPILLHGKDALKTWIEKVLRTRMGTNEIYEDVDVEGYPRGREYGTNIWELVKGRKLPALLIQAETKRDIEEALLRNNKIKRIENYRIEQGGGWESHKLKIEFDVITVEGEEDFPMGVKI